MKKDFFIGSLFVVGGAISYSVLATLVKLAYQNGYTTAEVTFSQYLIGVVFFGIISWIRRKRHTIEVNTNSNINIYIKLILGGSTIGLTGVFYYYSVQYLPISIAVVLLMQSTWLGIVIESILSKTFPSGIKIAGSIVVLTGTILATNAIQNMTKLSKTGIIWGLIAALTYAISMTASNKISTEMAPEKRSFYMLIGAFIVVVTIGIPTLLDKFDVSIFWTWGLPLALFGTVLPPFLFNIGMPKTGIGLGTILISIEIPISIALAAMLLRETITVFQWSGVLLILIAIVVINYKLLKKFKRID